MYLYVHLLNRLYNKYITIQYTGNSIHDSFSFLNKDGYLKTDRLYSYISMSPKPIGKCENIKRVEMHLFITWHLFVWHLIHFQSENPQIIFWKENLWSKFNLNYNDFLFIFSIFSWFLHFTVLTKAPFLLNRWKLIKVTGMRNQKALN